jgi:hypothetical protein
MIDVVKIERRGGQYVGMYEMYSQREADKRGIDYRFWSNGLATGEFLEGLEGPWCLTSATYNNLGKMIIPPMVIPVLKVNYNIWKVVPRLGRNCKQLTLATRTWFIYANTQPDGRTFFNPDVNANWNRQKVKTSLSYFMDGLTNRDFAFFALYMRHLTEGMDPDDAVLDAYVQAYNGYRILKSAQRQLLQVIEYMGTGAVDTSTIREAMKEAGLDSKFIADRLKDEATNKESKASERMDALKQILTLSGVTDATEKTQTVNVLYGGRTQGQALPTRETKAIPERAGESLTPSEEAVEAVQSSGNGKSSGNGRGSGSGNE